MLKELYIRNFALIPEETITFHPGFSVITGETGAGKSIILGALGLLLGNRADVKAIRNGQQKCTVEGHFSLDGNDMQPFFTENDIDYDADDCIIRREINISGKSRGFINDQPVSLALMKELGLRLIDIHSQHQNLLLQKEDFQLEVLDVIADNKEVLNKYSSSYSLYKNSKKALNDYLEQLEKSKENEDFMRFQLNELKGASLDGTSQEDLEQQADMMQHSEEIKTSLYDSYNRLEGDGQNGVIDGLNGACSALRQIVKVYPEASALAERLDSAAIEARDIADELNSRLENVDFDPAKLNEISDRLDTIYSLEQKYHVSSVDELIDLRDKIESQLSTIDNADMRKDELQAEAEKAEKDCKTVAAELSKRRKKAAKDVEGKMHELLEQLGMPNARFQITMDARELSPRGTDQVDFLFSANKSSAMQPVRQVASGGEISRVMLSLKAMISGTVNLPTIIFDEIDTGVSGIIAGKMAAIMKAMGEQHRQVISITHLPQIAAKGTYHYKVAKKETEDGTVSTMKELTDNERITEIALMLSGDNISEAAINNAKELLEKK